MTSSWRRLLPGIDDGHMRSRIARTCYRTFGHHMLDPAHWKQCLGLVVLSGILTAAAYTLLRIAIPRDATWLPAFMRTGAFDDAMMIVLGVAAASIVVCRGARRSLPQVLVSLGRCPRCGCLLARVGQASCPNCGTSIVGHKHTEES